MTFHKTKSGSVELIDTSKVEFDPEPYGHKLTVSFIHVLANDDDLREMAYDMLDALENYTLKSVLKEMKGERK
jgi:hypothetical protein